MACCHLRCLIRFVLFWQGYITSADVMLRILAPDLRGPLYLWPLYLLLGIACTACQICDTQLHNRLCEALGAQMFNGLLNSCCICWSAHALCLLVVSYMTVSSCLLFCNICLKLAHRYPLLSRILSADIACVVYPIGCLDQVLCCTNMHLLEICIPRRLPHSS